MPLVQTMRQILGLQPDCEVFPKQIKLFGESVGNWINIPYHNNKETVRYAYNAKGEQLGIEDALDLCFRKRVGLEELSDLMKAVPISQGPPCIQAIYMEGGTDKGERNAFLFNCCVYLKARFKEDFAAPMHKLNEHLSNPIGYERLDITVISSHNKKDYTYQCRNSVLTPYCDKEMCKLRPYGINSGDVSDLSFEQLTQYRGSKPYYIWIINGVPMQFNSESELMSQQRFAEFCLRDLHLLPKQMTMDTWRSKINRALENLEVELIDEGDELSQKSLWMGKLAEFLGLSRAMRRDQVNEGMVWYNPVNKGLYFKGAKLFEFITRENQFRNLSEAEHREWLKAACGKSAKLTVNKRELRTWKIVLAQAHHKGLLLEVPLDEVYEAEKVSMEPIIFDDAKTGGKY